MADRRCADGFAVNVGALSGGALFVAGQRETLPTLVLGQRRLFDDRPWPAFGTAGIAAWWGAELDAAPGLVATIGYHTCSALRWDHVADDNQWQPVPVTPGQPGDYCGAVWCLAQLLDLVCTELALPGEQTAASQACIGEPSTQRRAGTGAAATVDAAYGGASGCRGVAARHGHGGARC